MKKITIIDGVFHEEEVNEEAKFDGPIKFVTGLGILNQVAVSSTPYSELTQERMTEIMDDGYFPHNESVITEMSSFPDSLMGNLRMENAIRQSLERELITAETIRNTISEVFAENPFSNVAMGVGAQRDFDEMLRRELARQYPYTPREATQPETDEEITRYLNETTNANSTRRTRRANRPSQPETNQP